MADKLTTEEILALCRRQDGGDKSAPAAPAPKAVKAKPAAEQPAPGGGTVEPTPVPKAPAAPAKPAATPSSTADILAAARAQKAAGATPAAPPAAAKPAAPAAAPKSTADILAAARAERAKGVDPAATSAAEKPKKAPTVTKPGAPAAKLSVAEMLAAARGEVKEVKPGGGAVTPAAPAHGAKPAKEKLELPPIPQKPPREAPALAAARAKENQDRRGFLGTITSAVFIAWAAFIATTTAATLGMARFMFPNVLVEPPSKFKVGPPSDFPLNTVSNKYKAQYGVWIVHTDSYNGQNMIYALSTVCTHLGCTPNWLDGEQKYKCPCHGSGFYMNGINFEGPAPRPLERVGIVVAADGNLEVDKSKKFQEELGQWTDATSFVEIA